MTADRGRRLRDATADLRHEVPLPPDPTKPRVSNAAVPIESMRDASRCRTQRNENLTFAVFACIINEVEEAPLTIRAAF